MLQNRTAKSTKVSDIFLFGSAKDVTDSTKGKVFNSDFFAKDWDSIYVRPDQLREENVTVGMRKIVEPTLVITTHANFMAYILASEDMPVYLPGTYYRDKDGYVLATKLSPLISPEYVYYLCQYEQWQKMINTYTVKGVDTFGPSWDSVGITGDYDLEQGCFIEYSPLDFIRNYCYIELPSISQQEYIVEAAKKQGKKNLTLSAKYNVVDLVSKYMAFSRIKNIFTDSAYGLLAEIYRRYMGDNANFKVIQILSQYSFEPDFLNEEELDFLSLHLADAFDLLVNPSQYAHGKEASFLQPKEVTEFLCEIAGFGKEDIVYNPFAGAASYAVNLPNPVMGEELNPTTWALAQVRLATNKVNPQSTVVCGNSFESIKNDTLYKAIITSPIYSNQENQEIFDIVRGLYNKLLQGGTLVCLVTQGFLHSSNKSYKAVKERLINDRAINAVISLPANIFPNTNVSLSALIITKGIRNENILFADATAYTRFSKSVYRATTFENEQFLKDLSEEIQDFYERGGYIDDTTIGAPISYEVLVGVDLTPKRYLTPIPQNSIALSELVEDISDSRLKGENAEYFITGSSIPEAMHRKPFVPIKSDGKIATSKNQVQISDKSVIIAYSNGTIRTVYTEGFTGKIAFPSNSIKIVKPKDGFSAQFVAALISMPIVANQIKALAVSGVSGTASRINSVSISEIYVPFIDKPEERERLVAEVLASEMSEFEIEQQQDNERREREIRSTRHAMIQTLAQLSSSWSLINDYAQENNGHINLSDKIGRINPMYIDKLFASINHAIKTLSQQVDSLKLEVQDWGVDTAIDPYEFINQYISTHETPMFQMRNVSSNNNIVDVPWYDEETGKSGTEHIIGSDIFYAPKRLIEHIFNNIVSNAQAHGFINSDRKDYLIRFDWAYEDGNIVITIANNGMPLKEGVTPEDVFMRGFTTALNSDYGQDSVHFGQGGFEIKSLMNGYGKAEIINNSGDEFPVVYKLTFEKTNSEVVNLFED